MNNETVKKLFFGAVVLLGIGFGQAAAAGCCTITTSRAGSDFSTKTYIETETEEACLNQGGFMIQSAYDEKSNAAPDNKSCIPIEEKKIEQPPRTPVVPKLSVSIPGFGNFSEIKCDGENPACEVPWLGEYIEGIYTYSLTAIGILAVLVIMIGGVIWLTAGGSSGQIGEAKKFIQGGLLGATLAACSYILLFLINPNLTILKPLNVGYVDNLALQEVLPLEDLTAEFTAAGLPQTELGTSSGDYKVPVLFQGRFKSLHIGLAPCGCGPTSLTMVLNYYGVNKTVPQIAADTKAAGNWTGGTKLPTNEKDKPCGGWTGGMAGFKTQLDKYNLKSKTGTSFDDIKSLLSLGPVIASIKGGGSCAFTGHTHYVVFTGFKDGKFYTNDPNEGNLGGSDRGPSTKEISESDAKSGCSINAGVIAVYK